MSKPIIKLFEYKTSSSDDYFKETDDEIYKNNKKILTKKKLENTNDLKLAEELQNCKILTIKKLASGLEISTTSHIGSVEFSNFIVKILPKHPINIENIYRIIDYIWNVKPLLQIKFLENSIDIEKDVETLLVNIIINSLIKQCKILLKQGLLKSYTIHEENISFLRGKLLINSQIQNNIRNNVKFACQFDELEYDILENQILLHALSTSHNITDNDALKCELRILIRQYSMFASHSLISSQDFDKINYDGLNQHYELAHNLSKLILEATGFRDYRKEKKIKIKPFFINMNEVFEKFIQKLFEFYYSRSNKYEVISQKTTKAWKSDKFNDYKIRTDILVIDKNDDSKKFIVDAKYKKSLTPNDRYQVGFYIHEYGQRHGSIILPKFQDDTKDTIISEKQEIIIHVECIDINKILNLIAQNDDTELLKEIGKIIYCKMK